MYLTTLPFMITQDSSAPLQSLLLVSDTSHFVAFPVEKMKTHGCIGRLFWPWPFFVATSRNGDSRAKWASNCTVKNKSNKCKNINNVDS